MDCLLINYCGTNGYLIRNNRIKSDLIKSLSDNYDIDLLNYNGYIYNDVLIERFEREPYLVSFLSGGSRSLLWILNYHGIPTCLLLDRNINENKSTTLMNGKRIFPKVVSISLEMENLDEYIDSVWEIEINKKPDDEEWTYLLSDLLVLEGKPFKKSLMEKILLMIKFYNDINILIK